jgi:uncharacterized repeat protein (TIGR03803 family)
MLRNSGLFHGSFFCGALLLIAASSPENAFAAGNETLLYSFKGGNDGSFPQVGLIADASGNLYGTTTEGGGTGCGGDGCGTVFKLAPDGTETVLHSFQGDTGGANPQTALIADASGNLYGATTEGGGSENAGTVFEVAPDGTETILYAFCSRTNCADGAVPYTTLAMDKSNNIYGTTAGGGTSTASSAKGHGVVFKLAPGGVETVLHAFGGGSDGQQPIAVLMNGSGNLYGVTEQGGSDTQACMNMTGFGGCGTAFEISSDGKKTILYDFCSLQNCVDGWVPGRDLAMDGQGNLYGPTCCAVTGNVVFKLAPNGQETVLHTFTGEPDGVSPMGSLSLDKKGNLYGATLQGGSGTGCEGQIGCGTVFELSPSGTETILHSFTNGTDGTFPSGGVISDRAGNLFGTTYFGGQNDNGTIFEITK